MDSSHNFISEAAPEYLVVKPKGLPKDTFRGPEFRANRQKNLKKKNNSTAGTRSNAPSILLDLIACTSCNQQINPFATNGVFEHPVLHVILCKSCHDYYHSGDFDQDEDGIDNYCRWCGDGGTLTVCEECTYVFCRSCIRRHVSRQELTRIKEESFICFVCNPTPIKDDMEECKKVLEALKEYKAMESKSNSSRTKPKKSPQAKFAKIIESSSSDSNDAPASTTNIRNKFKPKPSVDTSSQKSTSIRENGIRFDSISSASKRDHASTQPVKEQESRGTGDQMPLTPSRVSASPAVSVQSWKAASLLKLSDVSSTLQVFSKEFQTHFKDCSEKTNENHSAISFKRNFPKIKALKELKASLRKVSSQVSLLEKNLEATLSKYRSQQGDEFTEFDDADSSTAKESDSEDVVLMSPSKKKMLRKRKVLDSVRLSSSNENESPKKLPRRNSVLCNSRDDENENGSKFPITVEGILIKTEVHSSTELSDTGSSKLFRKNTVETNDSVGSLSDIFNSKGTSETKAKKKLSFQSSLEISDDASPKLTKCTVNITDFKKVSKNDLGLNYVPSQNKEKRNRILSSDSLEQSDSEIASDDQILPSSDAEMENTIDSDSNSGIAAEKNKLALENLKKNMQDEEEDTSDEEEDQDVDELLEKDKKKPAPSKSMAGDKSSASDRCATDEDSDVGRRKKSSYINPLLKVRISSSGSDTEKEKSRTHKRRRAADTSSDTNAKRQKTELKCDEALNDPNLSDDDLLLLQTKDKDLVQEDMQQSDVDILLSENEKRKNMEENNHVTDFCLSVEQNKKKKGGKPNENAEDSEDSAASELFRIKQEREETGQEEKKLTENESSTTDSDLSFSTIKKRKKQTNITQYFNNVEDLSSGDEFKESKSRKTRTTAKRNRRRVVISDSDEDDDLIEINNSSSSEDKDNVGCVEVGKSGRKNIRKIIDDTKLSQDTRTAEKTEMERRKRLEENLDDSEVIVIEDEHSPVKKVAAKLILSKNPLIEIDPSVVKVLKSHQIDGVKFLWKNVIETVARANNSKGDGCILAHCMGLGKTLQVITFLHAVLTSKELPDLNSALVICPLGTVSNWVSEFRKWLRKCKNQLRIIEFDKSNTEGALQLKNWQRRGGVAVMSYARYRNLCMGKSKKVTKSFLEMFMSSLQDPGPDIVVCDEGHVLKNEKTDLSSVVDKIRTKRRIVLTGTPLQNNLIEYHCMVSFIKPRLLGSKKEFSNRFVNPILNGQHVDSTKLDVHIMKKRSHVLHELLAGCVQRKDVECLRQHLTPKHEYVLFVRLSPLQVRLYGHYLKTFNCDDYQGRKGKLFQDFNIFLLISSHPRMLLLSKARQEEQEKAKENQMELQRFVVDDDEDEEESATDLEEENGSKEKNAITEESLTKMSISELKKLIKDNNGNLNNCLNKTDLIDSAKKALNLNKDQESEEKKSWFDSVLPTQDELINAVEHSGKMLLFLNILRLAAEMGDKVVAFSQSLLTLDLIELVLKEQSRQAKSPDMIWRKDNDYFRLDGSTCSKKRKVHIDRFNSKLNNRSRLFLISTRAGGIGINLVGANRAVLFDASWNPTHDVQSIFRIYRFGQEKPCYVYRLIAQGTMEEKIYERQVVKQSLAFRVVDEQQIERHFTANDIAELYTFKPKPLVKKSTQEDTPEQAPPKDRLLADLLKQVTTRDAIVSYHQHDSLLDHKVDEELTEEERRLAWDEYDRERRPLVADNNPMMKLAIPVLQRLVNAANDELTRNSQFLEKCKDEPLSDIMLNLKIQNRDLDWEKLNQYAVDVQTFKTKMRAKLENSRSVLIFKLEQLRYCLQRKSAAMSAGLPPSSALPNPQVPPAVPFNQPSAPNVPRFTRPQTAPRAPYSQYSSNAQPRTPYSNPRYTYRTNFSSASRFPGYSSNMPNGRPR